MFFKLKSQQLALVGGGYNTMGRWFGPKVCSAIHGVFSTLASSVSAKVRNARWVKSKQVSNKTFGAKSAQTMRCLLCRAALDIATNALTVRTVVHVRLRPLSRF